jgi:hypothetical protein
MADWHFGSPFLPDIHESRRSSFLASEIVPGAFVACKPQLLSIFYLIDQRFYFNNNKFSIYQNSYLNFSTRCTL